MTTVKQSGIIEVFSLEPNNDDLRDTILSLLASVEIAGSLDNSKHASFITITLSDGDVRSGSTDLSFLLNLMVF